MATGVQDVEGAKAYLNKHSLHDIFESLASEVLNERPEEPLPFLLQRLSARVNPPPTAGDGEQAPPLDQEKAPVEAPPQAADPAAGADPAGQRAHDIVFVLGGPGSGKTTLCNALATARGFVNLDVMALLCSEAASDSELAREVGPFTDEGRWPPTATVHAVLRKAFATYPPGSTILLDGFPLHIVDAIRFERDVMPIRFALHLHAPNAVLENRMLTRGLECGTTDDNIASIRRKLAFYAQYGEALSQYIHAIEKAKVISAEAAPEAVLDEALKHFA